MKETELQRFTCDCLRAHGGEGHIMSNRFLVGVADLLVKPQRPFAVALLEVKQKVGTNLDPRAFTLDVTVPQKTFLRKFHAVGGRAGVLSFLQNGGRRELYAAVFALDGLEAVGYRVSPQSHDALGGKGERERNLVELIERFCGI